MGNAQQNCEILYRERLGDDTGFMFSGQWVVVHPNIPGNLLRHRASDAPV